MPGVVQRPHAVPELVRRLRRVDAVARVRGVEAVGAVAPVVAQAARRDARRDVLLVERHHRQQLDVRDAELLQVRDLLDQAGEGAGVPHARGRMAREAADVQLVDHGVVQVAARPATRRPTLGRRR